MGDLAQQVVREPESETPEQFAHRVHQLAVAYTVLFVASLTGIGLLVWKAQLFVGLTQRSNVETLTLAFLMVFFGYIALLSVGGAGMPQRVAEGI